MKSKGRLKVLTVCSIFVLLFCGVATIGMLRSTTAAKAASPGSLNYHGVDRMGGEYSCLSSSNTFDGPVDQASVNAMLSWKINIVRLPMNEDCWLGINGEPSNGVSASQYRQNFINYVNLLTSNGMHVILDLQWTAPGSSQATGQLPMPDADHAPAFWSSVASTFKGYGSVLFDLYNEPYTSSWSCWRNGSSGANASPCNDVGFAVAGMQTLVNAVRNTGATNVIMLGGLNYANNLTGWLANEPSDPDNNLAASFHIYNFNPCDTISCLNSQVAPVAAQVPVIAGEMGEDDCAHGFIDGIMPWFDSHNIGYMGWTWDTYSCSNTPSLISDYSGTPTNYGVGLKNHLLSLPATGGGTTPTPTPTSGSGGGSSYEAESSANTLAGGAVADACSACSGGSKVGYVGLGGTLQFNNVQASSSGTYALTIYYVDGDTGRTAQMSVNGAATSTLTFNGTNDSNWNVVQSLTVSVPLNAGTNTILFSNPSGPAPDFDRITIAATSTGSTPTPTPTKTPTPAPTPTTTPTPIPTSTSGSSCKVSYVIQNQWPGGFTNSTTITNTGSSAISSWTLKFSFPGSQQVTEGWDGTFSQSGSQVTITNMSYNGSIASGASLSLGFNGTWTTSNPNPTSFTVNGATCSTS
jgi:hypothetical protein